MAKLDAIQFLIGLPHNIDPHTKQNKFEGLISKNVAKKAILRPKIASATVARAWHGYNLAIFHPILTNEYTKMTCSSRRIEWNKKL